MAAVQQHFIQNMNSDARETIASVGALGDRLDVVSKYDEQLEAAMKEKKDETATEVTPVQPSGAIPTAVLNMLMGSAGL